MRIRTILTINTNHSWSQISCIKKELNGWYLFVNLWAISIPKNVPKRPFHKRININGWLFYSLFITTSNNSPILSKLWRIRKYLTSTTSSKNRSFLKNCIPLIGFIISVVEWIQIIWAMVRNYWIWWWFGWTSGKTFMTDLQKIEWWNITSTTRSWKWLRISLRTK